MFRFVSLCLCLYFSLTAQSFALENRVIGYNLNHFDEDKSLGQHREARIFALADEAHPFNKNNEPLILVHGTNADPKILQQMVNRLKPYRYQIYVLAYSDIKRLYSKSGDDFSREILQMLPAGQNMTIVAHSAGGVITRRALNTLSLNGQLERFGNIRFFSIDTPWHGFFGPGDDDLLVKWTRYLIPDGYEEMRSRSELLLGLFRVRLPPQVSIDVVFAKEGKQALDYSDKAIKNITKSMVETYSGATSIKLTDRQINFWNALKSSVRYRLFDEELKTLFLTNKLNQVSVETALTKHFPKFVGNHTTVIFEPQNGESGYLDYLEAKLK